jgi:NitT/TauT family transport system ATP-binding protein
MTSRPGRIDKIVDIALPRPRELDMTTEPEFNSYVTVIRQVFERRGVLKSERETEHGRTLT